MVIQRKCGKSDNVRYIHHLGDLNLLWITCELGLNPLIYHILTTILRGTLAGVYATPQYISHLHILQQSRREWKCLAV
jgi:hypothetical protein